MKAVHVVALISLLLALHLIAPLRGTGKPQPTESLKNPLFLADYTPHEPISINNDSEFTSQGFSGSGTPEAPYILEEVSIIDNITCIEISGTRSYFEIRNCYISSIEDSDGWGILLLNVTNCAGRSCIVSTKNTGITLYRSNCSALSDNEVSNCRDGMNIGYLRNCQIEENDIHDNQEGIIISHCINTTICGNTIYSNSLYGGGLWGIGTGSIFANNTIHSHGWPWSNCALQLSSAISWTIEGNCFYDNPTAILDSWPSANCTFRKNRFIRCEFALQMAWSIGATIDSNTISDCYMGITLQQVTNSTLSNNRISNTTSAGIELMSCISCELEGNIFNLCGVQVDGPTVSSLIHRFSGNMVNNKSLGYFANLVDEELEGDSYGQILMIGCKRVAVQGGQFYNSTIGVVMAYCENCSITKASVHHQSSGGIRGRYLVGCRISRCSVYSNSQPGGIVLGYAIGCSIEGNSIYGNDFGGIVEDSQSSMSDCTVANNAIFDNSEYGIWIDNGWENIIYGNALGWNGIANANDNGQGNTWYSEELELGNWWHDYNSTESDVYEIPGSAGSVDRYPQKLTERIPTPPLDPKPFDFWAIIFPVIGVVAAGVFVFAILKRR